MVNYQYMMSADDVARELNCSKVYKFCNLARFVTANFI